MCNMWIWCHTFYWLFVEVGRVGNFAGYQIRVPGRIRIIAESGYLIYDVYSN